MKTILKTGLLTLLLVATNSCVVFQSKEHRAQNHLHRALSLDPTIIQNATSHDVKIKDSVRLVDSIRIKDSINTITRDSIIIVPKSDISGNVTAPCDSTGKLRDFDMTLGSGDYKVRVWSKDGQIKFTSAAPELVNRIHERDTYVSNLETQLRLKDSTHAQEIADVKKSTVTLIKYRPGMLQLIGGGLILLILGFVAGKLIKVRFGFLGL